MIYLLCKYDIISVSTYAKRISSVPQVTDIIEKAHFCLPDKSVLFHGYKRIF